MAKYGKKASDKVEKAMHERKKGWWGKSVLLVRKCD